MAKYSLIFIAILFISKPSLRAFTLHRRNKTCFGKHQMGLDSNLDIVAHQFEPIEFINFDQTPSESMLTNRGLYLQIDLHYNDTVPTIKVNFESALGLQGEFRLQYLYFQWLKQVPNSNLTIPAGFHAIFYDINAKSFAQAVGMNKSTIVLAFEIEVNPLPPHNFDVLQENLKYVRLSDDRTPIPNFSLQYWLNSEMQNFYAHEGGLFDFFCDGTVIWIDFIDTLSMAPEMFKEFQKIEENDNLKGLRGKIGETVKPQGKIFQNISPQVVLGQSPPLMLSDLEVKSKSAARYEMAIINITTIVGVLFVLISWIFF